MKINEIRNDYTRRCLMGWHDVVKDVSFKRNGSVHVAWKSLAAYVEHECSVGGALGRLDYVYAVHFFKGRYIGSGRVFNDGGTLTNNDDVVYRFEERNPDLMSRIYAKHGLQP